MIRALEKRLQLVTGKGGVGKSTVVAALALRAAQRKRRPLIVELGHRATMQSVFDVPNVGFNPVEVGPGVHALNIELEHAVREYIIRYVRLPRLVDKVLGNSALRRFFDAAPGVAETVTLAKLQTLFGEKRRGLYWWDPIFVDLDATGHALMLLELPRLLDELLGRGPLRSLMRNASELLCQPKHTALHLVAAPRPLVVQETRELYEKLSHEHKVPLGALFVNQMPAPPFDESLRAKVPLVKQFAEERGLFRLAEDAVVAERAFSRYERSVEAQRGLGAAVRLPQIVLPEVLDAAAPWNVVERLADLLPEVF